MTAKTIKRVHGVTIEVAEQVEANAGNYGECPNCSRRTRCLSTCQLIIDDCEGLTAVENNQDSK